MDVRIKNIIVCVVAVIATIYTFSYIATAPGSVMISLGGDAPKNYFAFLYHGSYGKGLHFEGMNYPYGEHIVFTDAQPVFVLPLSYIRQVVAVNPLAAMHVLLCIGFFLAIVYLYKVLVRFGVAFGWALPAAVAIALMSPQQLKLAEHFSLAYVCVLPVIFYYNLCWLQTNRKKYLWPLCFAIFIFTFLHLYYALMICFWVALYSMAYLLFFRQSLLLKIKHLVPLWFVLAVPMACFQLFMFFTDKVAGRPSYPYGARHNKTNPADIYTSFLSPYWKWAGSFIETGALSGGNEGYTYTGVIPMVVLFTAAMLYVIKAVKKRNISLKTDAIEQSFAVWLTIAAGMLVFATSIIFTKCFVCLDYASFIRQFRAVGRFSWAYYYIATVLAVVLMYRWYIIMRAHRRYAGVVLSSIICLLWVVEALPFANHTRAMAEKGRDNYAYFFNTDTQNWGDFLKQHGYSKDSFSASLVLPYYHVGTEKLGYNPSRYYMLKTGFSCSYQLQLPLVNVMMSRNSWKQAFEQIKLAGGAMVDKTFLKAGSRDVLVLADTAVKLHPGYMHLLSAATKIGRKGRADVYALNPAKLAKAETVFRDSLRQIYSKLPAGDTCISARGPWVVEHYDTANAKEKFYGTGAARPIETVVETLINMPMAPAYDNQYYEFSAWTLVPADNYKIPRFKIFGYDANDSLLFDIMALTQEPDDSKGLWLRTSKYFEVPEKCVRLKVEIINVVYPAYLALDELMIRPSDAIIISKWQDGRVMVNNHPAR